MDTKTVGTAADMPPISTLARWVVSAAQDLPHGSLLTYPALAAILQVDPQGHRGRSAILRAQRILLDERNKYLACVPGKGYEIARPAEHAAHCKKLRKQGIRKVVKSHRVSVRVDITGLTADELKTLTLEQTKAGAALSYLRQVESKRTLASVQRAAAPLRPRDIVKAITGT